MAEQLAEVARTDPLRARPELEVVECRHDQSHDVRATITKEDGVLDQGRGPELVLDGLRRDVLAAGRDQQVLLPVRDAQESVVIELADVAGREPAAASTPS
jgi:hypothetical protein